MTGYTREEALDKTPKVLKSGIHDDQFYHELWKTILSGEVFQSEIANRKKGGELFYEVKTITPLRDEHGDITHFVATGKDVTDHKRAEEELRKAYDELELRVQERTEELRIANSELEEEIIERRRAEQAIKESEEKYRSLFSNMSEGFALHEIILDADGMPCDYRFLEVNDAFRKLTGMSRQQILGRTVREVLPDIEPEWIETYSRVALSGMPVQFVNYSTSLKKWYETYCYSPRENQFAVVFFDITERKKAEEALRQSQVDLDQAQQVGQIGSWRLDVRQDVLTWSDENYRIFGVPKGTPLSYQTFLGIVHPDDRQYVDAQWNASLAGGSYDIEHRLLVGGQEKWVREKAYLEIDETGSLLGGFGITQDITERKQAEEALRAARDELELRVQERTKELALANQELLYEIYEREEVERQLRVQTTAMKAAANGIIITDPQGEILWTNPALTHMTGYTEDELSGQTTRIFRSGQHDPEYYRQMWATILAGQVWYGETTNRRKDGSLYIEEQTITPVRAESGQISHFIGIKQDITEHKQIEAALELERSRLKNILDTIPDGVYIISQDYDIEYANPVVEREFGAVVERKCFDYFHDLVEPCPWCKHEEVFAGLPLTGEHTYLKNNKSYEIFDAPLVNSDGSVSKLKLLHDITQRKKMELDLEQSNQDLQAASSAERRQRQLAEALVEAALVLNKSLELDEVLMIILEQIRLVIPYQFADIGLLEGEAFYDASHQGDADLPASQVGIMKRYLLGDFPLLKIMCQSGKPVLIPDTEQEQKWIIIEGFEWCRSFLSAPLIVEKQVIGFVNLFASQTAFYTEEMCNRLVAFASHAAAAIQNAWLFEQVRASSERLQSLSRRLVEVQESERLYIARELHDEAGQMLTSLVVDLRLLEKRASEPKAILKLVSAMEISLNSVIENLHRIAMALRPASLDHVGLVAALRQLVESVGEKNGLKVSFKSKTLRERLPANVETVLYRIVQESLTNVVRHARATRVDVILTVRDDKLVVIIEDDGIGFDPESVSTGEHLGLFGVRERAEMIDGKLVIESTPGKGTTIMVEVDYVDTNIDC
jgi:PAS domain S-box-containing protein